MELHPYLCRTEMSSFLRKYNVVVTAHTPLASGQRGPMQEKIISDIAQKHHKTPAQILLRWNVQNGNVIIPKSQKLERLIENKSIFDFELSEIEMQSINGLDCGHVFCDPKDFFGVPVFAS